MSAETQGPQWQRPQWYEPKGAIWLMESKAQGQLRQVCAALCELVVMRIQGDGMVFSDAVSGADDYLVDAFALPRRLAGVVESEVVRTVASCASNTQLDLLTPELPAAVAALDRRPLAEQVLAVQTASTLVGTTSTTAAVRTAQQEQRAQAARATRAGNNRALQGRWPVPLHGFHLHLVRPEGWPSGPYPVLSRSAGLDPYEAVLVGQDTAERLREDAANSGDQCALWFDQRYLIADTPLALERFLREPSGLYPLGGIWAWQTWTPGTTERERQFADGVRYALASSSPPAKPTSSPEFARGLAEATHLAQAARWIRDGTAPATPAVVPATGAPTLPRRR
jgi:hypothetical protein